MRAVVDGSELLDIAGTPPTATRRMAWMIGCSLRVGLRRAAEPAAAASTRSQLTLLVVQAFGAAAIGRFTSLPWTFVGGLVVGVLASLGTKWFTSGLLSGLPPAMPFVVLFVVLLVTPKRYLPTRPAPLVKRGAAWSAPLPVQLVAGIAVFAFLLFVPEFAGTHLTAWTVGAGATLLFLSLGLLVRTSGQVSLAHVGFSAIGACAFSQLAVSQDLPWFLALILAGLVAVPDRRAAGHPGHPARRPLPGACHVRLRRAAAVHVLHAGLHVRRDRPGDPDAPTGRLCVRRVVLPARARVRGGRDDRLIVLDRSRLGRLLRGMSDSPLALVTNGVTVNVTRVLVFCLSAFLAGGRRRADRRRADDGVGRRLPAAAVADVLRADRDRRRPRTVVRAVGRRLACW